MNVDFMNPKIPSKHEDNHDISKRELEFATFCIEILREAREITSKEAYCLLVDHSSIMHDFLIPNYEILHSQSREYILEEIEKLLEEVSRC